MCTECIVWPIIYQPRMTVKKHNYFLKFQVATTKRTVFVWRKTLLSHLRHNSTLALHDNIDLSPKCKLFEKRIQCVISTTIFLAERTVVNIIVTMYQLWLCITFTNCILAAQWTTRLQRQQWCPWCGLCSCPRCRVDAFQRWTEAEQWVWLRSVWKQ